MIYNTILNTIGNSVKIYGEQPASINHNAFSSKVELCGLTHKPFCVLYHAAYYLSSTYYYATGCYCEDENGNVLKNQLRCYVSGSSGTNYSSAVTAEYSETKGVLTLTATDSSSSGMVWGSPNATISANSFICIYTE